jgi:trehalose 6-phosphate phosphatase
MHSGDARMNALPQPASDWALFLDFDGTLVEIADHPDAVVVPETLPGLLKRLAATLDGAVAIVSGRSLAGLDALLDGALPAMAGVHGLERRDGRGQTYAPLDRTPAFRQARAAVQAFVEDHPGTVMEDKGNAITLHFRGAPAAADAARAMLSAHCHAMGDEFVLMDGKQVLELKPADQHKGTVVQTYMREPPFAGRVPVFMGDDVTDEYAFAAVNQLGGHTIRVGDGDRATAAHHTIDSVNEALQWLNRLARQLADHR